MAREREPDNVNFRKNGICALSNCETGECKKKDLARSCNVSEAIIRFRFWILLTRPDFLHRPLAPCDAFDKNGHRPTIAFAFPLPVLPKRRSSPFLKQPDLHSRIILSPRRHYSTIMTESNAPKSISPSPLLRDQRVRSSSTYVIAQL